jgi:hypothetical protein
MISIKTEDCNRTDNVYLLSWSLQVNHQPIALPLSDAAHVFMDVVALILSYGALKYHPVLQTGMLHLATTGLRYSQHSKWPDDNSNYYIHILRGL